MRKTALNPSAQGAHHDTDTELKMQIEIDDVEIEAKAKAMLETAVLNVIKEHIGGYVFTRTLSDRKRNSY
jgi:hypothetical protein